MAGCITHGAGKRLHRATLDDYANMARAALALYEATGETRYLDQTSELGRHRSTGILGCRQAAATSSPPTMPSELIVRTKTATTTRCPPAMARMVGVLARLFHLTGR